MTVSTRTESPWPGAVILEGWHRLIPALRDLAANVDDPWDLRSHERAAVLALVPHFPESVTLARFVAYADAERELAAIPDDDYSAATACRRDELVRDCGRLFGELVDGHPFAPAWPIGDATTPDPVYAAELYERLRGDRRELEERVVRLQARIVDLETANLSLEQLVDAQRHGTTYTLTEAGVRATGGATVLELPVAGAE